MTIEAKHYAETRQRLVDDQIVREMAEGIANVPVDQLTHQGTYSGTPRFEFMQAANAEYYSRGGDKEKAAHLGAVAEALLLILGDEDLR